MHKFWKFLRIENAGYGRSETEPLAISYIDSLSHRIHAFVVLEFILLIFAFLGVNKPSQFLFRDDSFLKLAFADVDVSYFEAIVCTSVFLIGIYFLIQLYLERWVWERLKWGDVRCSPYLLNLAGFFPGLVNVVMHYLAVPFMLLILATRASPLRNGVYFFCYAESMVLVAWYFSWRHRQLLSASQKMLVSVAMTAGSIFFLLVVALPTEFRSSGNFRGAVLERADMHGAFLVGTDMTYANMAEVNLSGANLKNARIFQGNFHGADLRAATLEAELIECNFVEANLGTVSFRGARLDKSSFYDAKFDRTDFTGASLLKVNFGRVDLSSTTGIVKSEFCKADELRAVLQPPPEVVGGCKLPSMKNHTGTGPAHWCQAPRISQ